MRHEAGNMPFHLDELNRAFDEWGLGLGALAAKVGKDKSTISRYLAGRVPMTVDMLDAIADAIGVPVTRFFDREDAARDASERAALALMRNLTPEARDALLRFGALGVKTPEG